ncbi:zinc-binding dehydrogenase [Ramlibacter ginsenosidimutans]|uniref:Zinc-binding dehydrogenase n=1 Tax=Ramlibacter ginsenosidimutans TaxID=502333 RepID=A0A934TTV4_9BURK|nr:medium chain dehydrogenase/reductase family protein [Ramlibacter ginsenosidimutans]MBK6007283.1 zinc-binding dehydrogenase [Ramlibacter ginsenosidimutans]
MKNMRVVVTRYGGPDVLSLIEEECPEPKPDEARVRVLAAGVSLPDVMMREGIHPEKPVPPFTPGWDLVGTVDRVGARVRDLREGQLVAAVPITGAYAQYVCLPREELLCVPPGVDPAEAVSIGLNYVTAWQMLHRAAHVKRGDRVLVHGAAGGVGTALLQLGRLAGLEMYGTCAAPGAAVVAAHGATPIDYEKQDFVREIHRLVPEGLDVVFDSIGGSHIWRSREALRAGGRVIAYGLTGSLRGGRITGERPHRLRGLAMYGLYIAAAWVLPGRRRVVPYSIQWLKRRRPDLFREDLGALLDLLRTGKIRPIIFRRFPLAQARQAQELLGQGGVTGKIVLIPNEPSRQAAMREDAGTCRAELSDAAG